MTFVAHQPAAATRYLRSRLWLPDWIPDTLECAAPNFSPLDGDVGSDEPMDVDSEMGTYGEALMTATPASS